MNRGAVHKLWCRLQRALSVYPRVAIITVERGDFALVSATLKLPADDIRLTCDRHTTFDDLAWEFGD